VLVPDLYWADAASIGSVQARYWQPIACLQASSDLCLGFWADILHKMSICCPKFALYSYSINFWQWRLERQEKSSWLYGIFFFSWPKWIVLIMNWFWFTSFWIYSQLKVLDFNKKQSLICEITWRICPKLTSLNPWWLKQLCTLWVLGWKSLYTRCYYYTYTNGPVQETYSSTGICRGDIH